MNISTPEVLRVDTLHEAPGSRCYLASKSQKEVSSLIQGLEGSVAETNGSYSMNCSV